MTGNAWRDEMDPFQVRIIDETAKRFSDTQARLTGDDHARWDSLPPDAKTNVSDLVAAVYIAHSQALAAIVPEAGELVSGSPQRAPEACGFDDEDYDSADDEYEHGVDDELDVILSSRGWRSARTDRSLRHDGSDRWCLLKPGRVQVFVSPVVRRGFEVMIWVGGELLEPQLFEIDTAAFISVVPAMEQAVERASLRQLSDADLLASVVEAANPVMRQQSGNASSE
ncbi:MULTISPECIES: hypothetical protein [Microbacterium]|uniref:hypothetical protein n=1 Tax=Microbacterium TaxID=33882 RepID=UPI00109BD50D|nr:MULTISPECIES: hypothetical protein [Microbacterium]QNA91736.1 hypothetical protein G4G29_03450 [Microbacterium sp. Se63.02b]QYM64933.1 hypothetical protein K1X59_03440 [Microbacterium sp. Se5.02b]CAD5137992.1 protein of unknown function [Microbacterium sp. Nx66]